MAFSIKGLIDNPNRRVSSARGPVPGILLQGIARHAFPSPSAALADFEAEMETFGARFENVQDEDAAMQLAGEAVERLQAYAASTERFIAGEGKQLQDALALLVASLVNGRDGAAGGTGNLLEIKAELESTSTTGDLVALNAGLRLCLSRIGNEVDGLRQRHSELLRDLDRAARVDVDAATGLPGISSAIRAIRTAMERGTTRHIYAFRVENMEVISRRFGSESGGQVLLYFAQYVAQRLTADDVLFRWRGPCFVAVSAGTGPALTASDVAKIVAGRLEYSITVNSRQVDVPVVCSWNALKLSPDTSMDDLLVRLDEFAIRGTNGVA